MRRLLLGLAVTALTVLAFAGPAGAASGQVTHFKFSGAFAEAGLVTSFPGGSATTFINVSQSNQASELDLAQFIFTQDANGNSTGQTIISTVAESGFSFTVDQGHLAGARLSASGLPVVTCTSDANGNVIGCSDTTIDLNVSLAGQGPISRGVSNQHFKTAGLSVTSHSNGTDRNAVAAGTIGGITYTATDQQFADFGISKGGTVTV